MSATRTYRRGGIELLMRDVMKWAPYLSKSTLQTRMERWENGKIDCDGLFRLSRGQGQHSGEFDSIRMGPRLDIADIRISAFELGLGREIEERNQRRRNGR